MSKLRLGIVGLGQRGEGHLKSLVSVFKDRCEVKALCDLYEDRINNGAKIVEEAGFLKPYITTDYTEIIKKEDIDCVMVFSSWESHIKVAICAMRAGKIVAMEVGGTNDVEECWELVKAYEETKTPFMFLENCCYGKGELLALRLVREGLFGDVVHCHGAYGHDLREEVTTGKEKRHYRLNHYLNRNCENYPTHELGPIAKILDINRGNKMVSLVSVASKSAGLKQYISDHKDSIVNKELIGKEFAQGDVVNTIITCENGETITLKLDTTLPRFYSREFSVHGTKGMYEAAPNIVYIDGCSEEEFDTLKYYRLNIDNGAKYEQKYLPDCWRNQEDEIAMLGHGGIDYLVFNDFFDAVENKREMPIDVYDAAAWMCITPLSEESIKKGGAPVSIPDFTNGKWKERQSLDVMK